MDGVTLFTYTISIAVACMSLALAIAARIFHNEPWNGYYITFQSCLIGIMVLSLAKGLSLFFMPNAVFVVFKFIFTTASHLGMAFLIVFLPYFLSWVIAKPWRKFQWCAFCPLALAYFGVGLASQIVPNETFYFWATFGQTIAFLIMYIYCIVTLWNNLRNIENKQARGVCLAVNITSLCLIPLCFFAQFFEFLQNLSYPIYVLAFSIIILVYYYSRFNLDKEKSKKTTVLSLDSLSQYKITEREFSVVQLICEGLTNKEIANELSISVNTVNNHVANIFDKTGVRSRIDLLKLLKEGPWA
jgi:DNA-binding CsgD family transcriptional regulator